MFKFFQSFRIKKNGPQKFLRPSPPGWRFWNKLIPGPQTQKFLTGQKFLKPKNFKISALELSRSGLGFFISHFLANLMPVKVERFGLFSRTSRNFDGWRLKFAFFLKNLRFWARFQIASESRVFELRSWEKNWWEIFCKIFKNFVSEISTDVAGRNILS